MKVKVTVTRAEYKRHTFEFEVEDPDSSCEDIIKATAEEEDLEAAYDHDFNNDPSPHEAFYEVEEVEVVE